MSVWESRLGEQTVGLLAEVLSKEERKGNTYAMGMTNHSLEVAKVINNECGLGKAEFVAAIPGPNNEKVTLVFRRIEN